MVGDTIPPATTTTITSCITKDCIDTILKYAIILNNIGVSLLEKHYYEQAMIPLKDSLSLIRSLVSTHDGKTYQQHYTLAEIARNMHQCAIQLASQTLSSSKRLQVVNFDSMYLSDVSSSQQQQVQQSVNVVDVQVTAGQTYPSSLPNESTSKIPSFTLLRMDEVPIIDTYCCCCCTNCSTTNNTYNNNEHTTEIDSCRNDSSTSVSVMMMMINIQSSIILHNVGLAAYCISKLKLVQQQQQQQGEETQTQEQEQARNNNSSSSNHIVYHNAAIQSLQSSHTMYIKALQGLLSISSLSRTSTNTSSSSSSSSSNSSTSSSAPSASTSSNNSQRTTASDIVICPITILSGLVVITKSVITSLQQEQQDESKHSLLVVGAAETSLLPYYQRVLHDTQHRLIVLFEKKEQYGFITSKTTAVAA